MKKNKIWITIFFIVIIIGFVLLCYYEVNKKVEINVGGEIIVIDRNTNENIDIKSLQSEKELEITKIGDEKVRINNQELNDKIEIDNIEISKSNKIKIEIPYFIFFTKTYYINTLPSDFPEYEVEGKSLYEGDYYLTTYNNLESPYYLFKLDENGEIKYYKKTEQVTFDFKKDIIDGKTIYSYLEVVNNEASYSGVSYCPCKLVIMNENYEKINEISYYNKDGTNTPLENHGGLIIGENHYILSSIEEAELSEDVEVDNGFKNKKFTNNKIEEVIDGKVVWEFETIDYPELFSYFDDKTLYDAEYIDYAHYNSCAIDKSDGNLICSFRNLDALIKINRTNGELMWILGGKGDQFNLTEEQKFAKQHAINILEDGTILLFDNANQTDESRILEFKIDEKNRKITDFKEYKLGMKSTFMGSAQKLDENKDIYTICYGGGPFKNPVLEEKDINSNEVYFSFNLLNSKYLYRVYKIK